MKPRPSRRVAGQFPARRAGHTAAVRPPCQPALVPASPHVPAVAEQAGIIAASPPVHIGAMDRRAALAISQQGASWSTKPQPLAGRVVPRAMKCGGCTAVFAGRADGSWPHGRTVTPRHPRHRDTRGHPRHRNTPRRPPHRDTRGTGTQRDAATLRGTATPRDLATPRHSATLRRWASATFRRRTAWSASTPRPRQPQRPGWSAPTPPGCCSLLPSAPRKAAWSRQRP